MAGPTTAGPPAGCCCSSSRSARAVWPSSCSPRRGSAAVVRTTSSELRIRSRRTKGEYGRLNAPRSWHMVLASPSVPLKQLEVLVVDCQATAAAPRGHLLEIGWARVLGTTIRHQHASLIALPDGERIPPAVARITGISEPMIRSAVDGRSAWRELTDQAASLTQPAPTVIHFARFEE